MEVDSTPTKNDNESSPAELPAAAAPEASDSESPEGAEATELRQKRKYNKHYVKADGLSGSYWQTPSTENTERPKRTNAGLLMKSALKEIDPKKRRQEALLEAKDSPPKTPKKRGRTPKVKEKDSNKDEALQPSTSRLTSFRVLPYEKPVTRGRGRPRKERVSEPPPEPEPEPEVKPTVRTYSRKSAPEKIVEPPKEVEKPVRTYGRRKSLTKAGTPATPAKEPKIEKNETSDDKIAPAISPARVTPSMALIAALSIPDKILPTTHEKFLEQFRETQEKSPTPPDRRVPNLDEVMANYKTTNKSKTDPVKVEEQSPESTSDSDKSETESNSGSASSVIGDKENAVVTQVIGPTIRLAKTWSEDENIPVVKLENNKLLINNEIVEIDYTTNYKNEEDFKIPYDYDIVFEPEAPLEVTSKDIEEVAEPAIPANVNEPCKLEACKKGCVCASLREPPPLRLHCGRPKCFFQCSCLFKDQLLINGDERNIRSRLRPRVTLLNWKDITKNGTGGEDIHTDATKKHKKIKITKKKRGEGPEKHVRSKTPVQSSPKVVYTRPGPKSSKLKYLASPVKGQHQQQQRVASGEQGIRLSPAMKRPTLISTRYASNLPILRRIYSCQPCHIKLTKMPNTWSDWKKVEEQCSSGVSEVQRKVGTSTQGAMSFQTASSNFRVSAQSDLSFVIVRPNGSILALLYWEAHTKQAPRSFLPKPPAGNNSLSFPWLYLPLPSSGKVWLFYEIPKYPKGTETIWLPEIGVFLPTHKLMIMMYEASKTGKTSKLYFESKDEPSLADSGLLSHVYLVPNLPSLIVYGPVPKTCLKITTTKSMDSTLKTFEESETNQHLKKQLDAAGTDVVEVPDESEGVATYTGPYFVDDLTRDDDLVEESVWDDVYSEFMIPVDKAPESPESDEEMQYGYDDECWEGGGEGYEDNNGRNDDDVVLVRAVHRVT